MQNNRQNAEALSIGDIALDDIFRHRVAATRRQRRASYPRDLYGWKHRERCSRSRKVSGGQSEFVSLLNHSSLTPRLLADLDRCEVGYEFHVYDDDAVDQRAIR